ncbi:MAG: acyl-CoA reductase [Campylobacterota bacterium]|nr:acyl-CoA reductase [Campylobacterota bacterium]
MSMEIVIPKNINSLNDLNIDRKVLKPFSNILVEFVNDVSKVILKDRLFKEYPELIALAFWMRKSHIKELHKYFLAQKNDKVLLGRGVVFHLAPSNVDTIFVYSWFISLLVGNSNILRISNKDNLQTNILISTINKVLDNEKYKDLNNKIAIIKYGHDDKITAKLSQLADVRVIWGGDNTVTNIRKIPIKPTAVELTFADKFSFAVLKSKELLNDKDIDKVIEKFYNDSFWFGQMACSSIRLVSWIGNEKENERAKKLFWSKLNTYVLAKVPDDISPADIVNKLVAECSMAIESNIKINHINNPYINKVSIHSIEEVIESLHCGTGLFYEMETQNLRDLMEFMTNKHQTIAYYGFDRDEITSIIYDTLPSGIDRVVPLGKSLDFSNVWDGFDLFKSFSREIEIC